MTWRVLIGGCGGDVKSPERVFGQCRVWQQRLVGTGGVGTKIRGSVGKTECILDAAAEIAGLYGTARNMGVFGLRKLRVIAMGLGAERIRCV